MMWILPMAGKGTRTASRGRFKPMIPVAGRTVMEWMLLGVREHCAHGDRLVFITTRDFDNEFGFQAAVASQQSAQLLPPDCRVVLTDDTPPGPAASVFAAARELDPDEPCTVVNCDQLIVFGVKSELGAYDGFMPLYVNSTGKSSYAVVEGGRIVGMREKELVSHYASAGVYGVGSARALLEALEWSFANTAGTSGEHFVGPARMHLLTRGGVIYPTTTTVKFDLGSEDAIARFERFATSWARLT